MKLGGRIASLQQEFDELLDVVGRLFADESRDQAERFMPILILPMRAEDLVPRVLQVKARLELLDKGFGAKVLEFWISIADARPKTLCAPRSS